MDDADQDDANNARRDASRLIKWCQSQMHFLKHEQRWPTSADEERATSADYMYAHWLAPLFDGCHRFSYTLRGKTASKNNNEVYLADERFDTVFFHLGTAGERSHHQSPASIITRAMRVVMPLADVPLGNACTAGNLTAASACGLRSPTAEKESRLL